tara:strand:+ start:50 stop:2728 length:2679 start_codon:yes stop_codon:yes gene_type:complete
MPSKTYLSLPVAPNEYDQVHESVFRSTVQNNLQGVSDDIVDLGNHTQKDASLSLRKFQFLSHRDNTPSEGKFFALTVGGTTSVTSILDEDDFSSDSATALATQQSIKAYVDTKVTAEDLDFAGGSGTGSVDLDSQTFTIAGTSNEIVTAASGQTLTISLPDDVTIGNDLTLGSDAAVLGFGADTDVTLTHVADTGLLLNSTRQLQFFDSSQRIAAVDATTLSIGATDKIDLQATLIDLNGNVDVSGNLELDSDGAVLGFGVNNDVTLTHVHDTGLLLNSTRQLQFYDSSQRIAAVSATVLSIGATDEIDLQATAIDINGTVDISGAATLATSLNIAGDGATVTGIKDEDNMSSNSATKLATQQSIKAYVDAIIDTITASTGLERVSDDIRAKVSGTGNLVDAMASGTPALEDYFIFEDNGDSTVKEGTLADLPFVTGVTAGAGLAKSGTLAPTLSVNAADGVRVTGDNVQLNVGGLSNAVPVAADSFVYYDDSASDHKRSVASAIPLSIFDNDAGFITSAFGTAGAGLTASSGVVSVKYATQGSGTGNLIDGAASGTAAGADLLLFQDSSDSDIVKKDSIADILGLVSVGAADVSAGTFTGNFSFDSNIDVDGVANLDNTDIDGTLVVDGSNISLDSTSTLNIDNSNTSNGITIGTATSGVPISIGHSTSEVTINDNLTVTGTFTLGSSAELTEAELEMLDGITAGTVAASKAVVVDSNKDIASFRNVTLTGELDAGSLDISGDADIDGTTNLDVVDIDGAVDMASTLTIASTTTIAGRLGIGTTSPSSYYTTNLVIANTSSGASSGMTLANADNGQGRIDFADGTSGAAQYRGTISYSHDSTPADGYMRFVAGGNEALRLGSNYILMANLPTSDPGVNNSLWNDSGTLKIS